MRNLILTVLVASSVSACGSSGSYQTAIPNGAVVVRELTHVKGPLPRAVRNTTIAYRQTGHVDVGYPVGSPHYIPNLNDFAGNNDGSGQ
jgi:hypothetical protein